jgi:hypothetical protein
MAGFPGFCEARCSSVYISPYTDYDVAIPVPSMEVLFSDLRVIFPAQRTPDLFQFYISSLRVETIRG